MKKIIALVSAILLCANFSGCGSTKESTSADAKTTTVETTTAKITTTAKATTVATSKEAVLIPYTYNDDIQLSVPDHYFHDKTEDAEIWTSMETGGGITILCDAESYQADVCDNTKAILALMVSDDDYALVDWLTISGESAIFFKSNDYYHCAFFNGNCLYVLAFSNTSEADVREIIKSIEIIGDSHSIHTTEAPTDPSADDNITLGMENALEEAKSYIRYSSFSYAGLIDQLEYEGYTHEECVYGADNCGADWYEQAVLSAESYIEYSAFSYSGLIGQLEYEGFTAEEAAHGADNCGADWYAEAAECAQSYMDYSSFSRQELLDQLLYEEFTYEEAEYGVQSVGY